MPNADLVLTLAVISLIGATGLTIKLFVTGLWKRYPIFFSYFVFRIPNTLWPLLIKSTATRQYEHIWLLTEPLTWIFHVMVVFELYRLVLQDHKGIYTLGKWAMYAALAVSIPISVLSLIPHFTARTSEASRRMGYEFATARGVDFSLALFLLLILFFLSRYPLQLSRNVILHAALYTVLFFSEALSVFLHTFKIIETERASIVLSLISCCCIGAWFFLLKRSGEDVTVHFPPISPQREEAALRQLQALNATLSKVSGK